MNVIPAITKDLWCSDFVRRGQPCVIVDELSEWPAARWSPEYLSATCSDRLVTVQVSHSGKWRPPTDQSPVDSQVQYGLPNVPFGIATEWVCTAPRGHKYYVPQHDLKQYPDLLRDLRFRRDLEGTTLNLWFGSKDTVSPLHYDPSHNWFGQVYGSKTVTLFHPDDGPHLYARCYGPQSHISPVDVDSPDLARYPQFSMAEPYEVRMAPGQMLFIPAFWWHHVRSTSVSISVNQWWRPELDECLGWTAIDYYIQMYKRDGWCQLRGNRRLDVKALIRLAEGWLENSPALAAVATSVAAEELVKWPGVRDDGAQTAAEEALRAIGPSRDAALEDARQHPIDLAPVTAAMQFIRAGMQQHRSTLAESAQG